MASVPIALTVLALVARESGDDLGDFLHRHADLFKFGSRVLLKGRQRNDVGVLNPEAAELILAQASLRLHREAAATQGDEAFPAENVEAAVASADASWLSPWRGPRHFIEDVSSHSSLIYPTDTLRRSYRYLHRTFREYFAALALSRLSRSDRRKVVHELLGEQQLAEVLVLLGGLTSDIQDYLHQLLSGPPDLALRTLREVKHLDPELASQVLQLKPGNLRERRQVFVALAVKLADPHQTVGVLRAYVESARGDIPRSDLYFIQEVLRGFDLDVARELSEHLLDYLPTVPPHILDSVRLPDNTLPYFCPVPAGRFLLGGAPDDPDRPPWVSTYSEVDVSAFQIGRVPVTNALYEIFDPRHRALRDFQDELPVEELDHHPVVRVSWYEAEMFCQWLSRSITGIRLPREAEWEKAAS